jgi:hypothetical protein
VRWSHRVSALRRCRPKRELTGHRRAVGTKQETAAHTARSSPASPAAQHRRAPTRDTRPSPLRCQAAAP